MVATTCAGALEAGIAAGACCCAVCATDVVRVDPPVEAVTGRVVAGLDGVVLKVADPWPAAGAVGWVVALTVGVALFVAGVALCVAGEAAVAVGVGLAEGVVTDLTMDPRVLVTGAVTDWMTFETPEVIPESGEGGSPVAALACPTGNDRSR